MLGVNVVAADTDDEARFLASSGRQSFASLRAGRPMARCRRRRRSGSAIPTRCPASRQPTRVSFVGSPATVHEQMAEFVDRTKADELIIVSHIYDHAARLHSYDIASKLGHRGQSTEFTEKTVRTGRVVGGGCAASGLMASGEK